MTEQQINKTNEDLTQQINRVFKGNSKGFRSCALFDERLDCIRVITRDCSVTEIRIDSRLTVLQDNDPVSVNRTYVGFTIKGAKHFCKEQGFPLSTPVKVADILDRILQSSPDPIVGIAVNRIARPLVEEEGIGRVDLSHQSVAVA